MDSCVARGVEFENKADKKLQGWSILGDPHEKAAELYERSFNQFKLAQSWEKAASVSKKLATSYLNMKSSTTYQDEAATAYEAAAECYRKLERVKDAISCYEKAMEIFVSSGKNIKAAKNSQNMGELFETENNAEQAMEHFKNAAKWYALDHTSHSNTCNDKVAKLAAQLEKYDEAIKLFEELARNSLKNNLLKYGTKGHLLNAGICCLCKDNKIRLGKYEDMDPTFSRTREHKFLSDLEGTIEEGDVVKFTDIVKEFDSMTPLDPWKTTLLLRIKEGMKSDELEDDLT